MEEIRERERKEFSCSKVEAAQALRLTFGLPINGSVVGFQQGLKLSEAQFPHLYMEITFSLPGDHEI